MSEPNAPALTADEWAAKVRLSPNEAVFPVRRAKLIEYTDTEGGVWNSLSLHSSAGAVFINTPDMHAVAAFCLHGQPFGFTADDARGLRIMADDLRATSRVASQPNGFGAKADFLEALAARIAALLPPAE